MPQILLLFCPEPCVDTFYPGCHSVRPCLYLNFGSHSLLLFTALATGTICILFLTIQGLLHLLTFELASYYHLKYPQGFLLCPLESELQTFPDTFSDHLITDTPMSSFFFLNFNDLSCCHPQILCLWSLPRRKLRRRDFCCCYIYST